MKKKYLLVLSLLSIYTANTFAQSSQKNASKFSFKLPANQALVLPASPFTNITDALGMLEASTFLSSMALLESVQSDTPDLKLSSLNRDYVINATDFDDDENLEDDEAALRSIMDKKAKVKETIVLQKPVAKPEVAKSGAANGNNSNNEGGLYEYIVKEAVPEVALTDEEKKQYNSRGMRVLSLLEEEAYSDSVFTKPDQIAMFPGGAKAFANFWDKSVRNIKKVTDTEKQNKTLVQFIVRKDGRSEQFRFMKSLDIKTSEAILAILYKMPNWEPASTKGAVVSSLVQLEVPIIDVK